MKKGKRIVEIIKNFTLLLLGGFCVFLFCSEFFGYVFLEKVCYMIGIKKPLRFCYVVGIILLIILGISDFVLKNDGE